MYPAAMVDERKGMNPRGKVMEIEKSHSPEGAGDEADNSEDHNVLHSNLEATV